MTNEKELTDRDYFYKYCEEIQRTVKPMPVETQLLHYALGIVTESGELLHSFIKYPKTVEGLKVSVIENMEEELGDILWYSCNLISTIKSLSVYPDLDIARLTGNFVNSINRSRSIHNDTVTSIESTQFIFNISDIVKKMGVYKHFSSMNLLNLEHNLCYGLELFFNTYIKIVGEDSKSSRTIMEENIEKLNIRYKDGYTNEQAKERNDKQ